MLQFKNSVFTFWLPTEIKLRWSGGFCIYWYFTLCFGSLKSKNESNGIEIGEKMPFNLERNKCRGDYSQIFQCIIWKVCRYIARRPTQYVFLELTVTKIFKVFRELDQNGQKFFLRFVLRILISSKSVSLLSNNGLIRAEWNHQNVSPLSSWWLNFSLLTRIQVKLLFCIIFQFWKIIWRSQKENGRAVDNFCQPSIKWRRPRSGVPNQSMLTNHYQGRNMGQQSATNISRMHSR